MKRLILFLVRKRLGLKLWQPFRFANQRSRYDYYFFEPDRLTKAEFHYDKKRWDYLRGYSFDSSGVSLNWILNDRCEIIKYLDDNKIPEPLKDRN